MGCLGFFSVGLFLWKHENDALVHDGMETNVYGQQQ